ncbi:MAG: hypothetical protein KDJ43_13025, partial [Rhizobiaceae bacterium]|nr:hypothetical protein [Rhizobiaceae bacterium]
AHVDQSDFSSTPLGKGVSEGRSQAVSHGLTRGHQLKVVSGTHGETRGESRPAAPAGNAPARSAPTARSGASVTALKPAVVAELQEEATAFKREYEERARELAEEIALDEEREGTADMFTEDAGKQAAEAKAIEAERRQKAVMQGYTGDMCSECSNFTMVRNGTCLKCDTCGSTSGCS